MIDSTEERDGKSVFVLNPPPTDTLYSHIATLCILVSSELGLVTIDEFLAAPINDSVYNWYAGDSYLAQLLRGVLGTEDYVEYEVENVDDSEGEYGAIPFIREVGFDRLWVPPEWREEVKEMVKRVDQIRPKYDQKWVEIERAMQESMAATEAAELAAQESSKSANAFTSNEDALRWLSEGSGIWLQDVPILSKKLGRNVKMYIKFKYEYNTGRGVVTNGLVDASTLRDVDKPYVRDTWILELAGNGVKYAIGDKYAFGELFRTGRNTASGGDVLGTFTRQ